MHPKPFNDLKFSRGLAILVQHRTGGGSHVRWKAHFLSSYGASSAPCFSQMRRQVQWQLQGEGFTCLDQYLCMAFAQLTYRESLRDIEACLRAQKSKLYHMGIRTAVSRNTLANANKVRDWLNLC